MMRPELVAWKMTVPGGATRRVFLDTATGRTKLNLLGGDVAFDEAAALALAQTATLPAVRAMRVGHG
jgi:hypothetical protein